MSIEKIKMNVSGYPERCIMGWVVDQICTTQDIEVVEDENADIVFLNISYIRDLKSCNFDRFKTVIVNDMCNYDDWNNDTWVDCMTKLNRPDAICVSNNLLLKNILPNHRVIYHDFLFNRSKAYYTDVDKVMDYSNKIGRRPWQLWSKPDEPHPFQFNTLDPNKKISKHYNFSFHRSIDRRETLFDLLYNKHREKGYLANRKRNIFVEGDNPSSTYYPFPNYYYDNTFASIAIESTSYANNIFHATEKLFEPVIKGTFPLIFSNPNYVSTVVSHYGFRTLPNTDYSYDVQHGATDSRFDRFINSVNNMLSLSLDDLQDIYRSNFDIIQGNRETFIQRKYDLSFRELLLSLI